MPWKQRALSNLERENDRLRTTICCLRREIENKQGAVSRLELLLHERLTKIDELNAKLDQSREQVRRLGLENELLAAMIAAPELSMTSEQAQAQSQASSAEPASRYTHVFYIHEGA
jgi:regulator of replication initiation timing